LSGLERLARRGSPAVVVETKEEEEEEVPPGWAWERGAVLSARGR